ncbi:hypothetical protein Acr_13g0009800 [Actinidia rufa]|uniref:2-oxoglutarate (2OG) and Fe(II)-dependent oxygenase superfamily protein n=1 Tax=Actinidia rufa TaxID=165716 RepID=A0A7J0FLT3_9ERIC|nr:hypothetical protein Acr_13g0009800 [Actinidia rufa]
MHKLLSNRCITLHSTVPESYILPPERRSSAVPPCKTIPVIDLRGLNCDRINLVQQIIKASQEYGFFQLTNHGVSEELMQDVLVVGQGVLDLPVEEKERFYSEDPNQKCRLRTSISYDEEKVHFWRDNFRHPCHPLEDYIHDWPQNPARYRWLGLECGYFGGDLSQVQHINTNHYPLCPDPSLVLGLPQHGDPYLLTLLNQGHVAGLQVLKDEQWLALEPLPNAFVVNINYMLQIISNGKLKECRSPGCPELRRCADYGCCLHQPF